jgi:hypothetical protein
MRRRRQAQIGARVRAVHLDNFCSGGLGLPVTTLRPAGLGPQDDAPLVPDGTGTAGQVCERCGRPIGPEQNARRRVTGSWVHENCPWVAIAGGYSKE